MNKDRLIGLDVDIDDDVIVVVKRKFVFKKNGTQQLYLRMLLSCIG